MYLFMYPGHVPKVSAFGEENETVSRYSFRPDVNREKYYLLHYIGRLGTLSGRRSPSWYYSSSTDPVYLSDLRHKNGDLMIDYVNRILPVTSPNRELSTRRCLRNLALNEA
jgi:hypothetical protein